MFNVQGSEIIILVLLALVLLGPEKLPEAIRKFSQLYGEFKKMSNGFQNELKNALDEPLKELKETADLVKKNADLRSFLDPEVQESLSSAAQAARGAITGVDPVIAASTPGAVAPTEEEPAGATTIEMSAAVATGGLEQYRSTDGPAGEPAMGESPPAPSGDATPLSWAPPTGPARDPGPTTDTGHDGSAS